jgi:polysaccharide biosynthesis transport protein
MNDQTTRLETRAPAGAEDSDRSKARNLDMFLASQDSETPLTQYFQILVRRRWIVLATIAAALALALFLSMTTTRLYRATATLEIAREASKVVDVKGVEPSSTVGNQEFYQTQYGLLKSRSLAEQVVRNLRLDDNDGFLYGYSGGSAPDASTADRATRRQALQRRATSLVQSHLLISPVRNSGLVAVSFDSPDPELSKRVANSIAENFIAANLARRFDASAYARRFLEERLAQTRAKLEESERSLVAYATRERLINVDEAAVNSDGQTSGAPRSLAAADLSALNTALVTAKSERIAAEARYGQARGSGGTSTTETFSDPAISALRSLRSQLYADYSKNLAKFKPDYPAMVAQKQQIDEIDRQISSQSGGIARSLRSEYLAAAERENALQARVNGLKDSVLDNRARSIQYNIYQRDADTNRTLYDGLLQRYKEIGIAGGVGTNNVSVVDKAEAPRAPFTPRTMFNLLLGLLAGTVLGGLLAFLIEQLDESIVAPHDLEQKLGIPLLGSVPLVGEGEKPLDLLEDRKSPLSEAYLSIQTALRFSTSHGAPRSLLVTSARAAEGKSTTSVSIARNFASLGRTVVLVDGDMRNPSLHRLMGLSNKQGLSDALAGANEPVKLMNATPYKGMSVITAGPLPPNPAELLAGTRLAEFVTELLKSVDHVVIDGPPVMGLADAPLIATAIEGTVFVIAAKETRAKAARIALRRLADTHAHIAGAVLTKFDVRQVGYDYAYSYEYGAAGPKKGLAKLLSR